MRKLGTAVAAAAALALPFLAASPASAASGWTVVNPDASGVFHADSGTVTVKAGSTTVTCRTMHLDGTLPSKSAGSAGLGRIANGYTDSCSDTQGVPWTIAISNAAPGDLLTAQHYDAAAGRTDLAVTVGYIFIMNNSCAFTLSSLNATYTNSGSVLRTGQGAVGYGGGCGIAAGTSVSFAAAFTVSPAVTITGPSA
ncbi:hypothetical protein amrb99_43780 [Actinomadura sp. RB99]|uniref:hypothetical protein n=1 Tax=Actinomadura sp. RB99 TaxID=2691577 RepID=UPI001687C8C6|nr:hypothetical protein [Actinomadura sp. RB99]MBD2895442.1 hypothetical protein [Actinomadura sp. RB99]